VTAFLPPRADECATAARALLARGVGAVVLTLGERGCMLMDQTTGPTDGPLIVPVPVSLTMRARVIDTVGAGDGFNAGFIAGRMKGWSVADALKLAALVGACAVTAEGDYEGYPTWREAMSYLEGQGGVER